MDARPLIIRIQAVLFAAGGTLAASAQDRIFVAASSEPGAPRYEVSASDEAVSRANEQVDFAEHQLAISRQKAQAKQDVMTRSRVEYYKNGVRIAHRQLTDALQKGRASGS